MTSAAATHIIIATRKMGAHQEEEGPVARPQRRQQIRRRRNGRKNMGRRRRGGNGGGSRRGGVASSLLSAAGVMMAATALLSSPSGGRFVGGGVPVAHASSAGGRSRDDGDGSDGADGAGIGMFLTPKSIAVSGLVEIDTECYEPLLASDANGDGMVDKSEYVGLLNSVSKDYFAYANGDFSLLPLSIKANFVSWACSCETILQMGPNCCERDKSDGTILTAGADGTSGGDGDEAERQALYLFTGCRNTYIAIADVVTPSPTPNPTRRPTTAEPTPKPTSAPASSAPTDEPTRAPATPSPTPKPTLAPTPKPTRPDDTPEPTTLPPTPNPTLSPTPNPTKAPATAAPTEEDSTPAPITPGPTEAPVTPAPTDDTSGPPPAPETSDPTSAPSSSPTEDSGLFTGDLAAEFSYQIQNDQGIEAQEYLSTYASELTGALEILVPQVVAETFPLGEGARKLRRGLGGEGARNGGGAAVAAGQRLLRKGQEDGRTVAERNLQLTSSVTYQGESPPTIEDMQDVFCPTGSPDGRACQTVRSEATLAVVNRDAASTRSAFTQAMEQAINEGRLQSLLPADNPVVVIVSPPPQPGSGTAPSSTLSANEQTPIAGGAIAGIVIGAIVVVGVIAAALFVKRKNRNRKDGGAGGGGGGPYVGTADSDIGESNASRGAFAHTVADGGVGGHGDRDQRMSNEEGLVGAAAPEYGSRSRSKRAQVRSYDDLDDGGSGASGSRSRDFHPAAGGDKVGRGANEYGEESSGSGQSPVSGGGGGGGDHRDLRHRQYSLDDDDGGYGSHGSREHSLDYAKGYGGPGGNMDDSRESASVASSSQAGSSGWSSSAGVSSLNTASVEGSLDMMDDVRAERGATLAAIGAASAVTSKVAARDARSQSQRSRASGAASAQQGGGFSSPEPASYGSSGGAGSGAMSGSGTGSGGGGKRGMVAAAAVGAGAALEDDAYSRGESTLDSRNSHDLQGGLDVALQSDAVPQVPNVSRSDLDSAIEAGDWAAVGATAALLASASETNSFKSASTGTESHSQRSSAESRSTMSGLDAKRAAELDKLVDAGDWEGVVLAAAKFEATGAGGGSIAGGGGGGGDSVSQSYHSRSGRGSVGNTAEQSRGDTTVSDSRSFTETHSAGSTGAFSDDYRSTGISTSVSESPSKAQKRAEVRSEVEALVRRVVPDEIDNVDEMMLQFQGREEELVETLRTMQERSIAQRARAAVHKTAKREAKQSVLRERQRSGERQSGSQLPPSGSKAGARTAGALSAPSPAPSSSTSGGLGSPGAAAGAATAALAAAGAAAYRGRTAETSDNSGFSDPQFSGRGTMPDSSATESSFEAGPGGLGGAAGHAYPARFGGEGGASESAAGESSKSGGGGRKRTIASAAAAAGPERTATQGSMSRSSGRTALELAIEAGDWEAVGEAAAMMSDASATTATESQVGNMLGGGGGGAESDPETGGMASDAEGSYGASLGSRSSGRSSRRSRGTSGASSAVDADRAAELDKLIDRGDWSGVVAAASKYSAIDAAAPSSSTPMGGSKASSTNWRGGGGSGSGGGGNKKQKAGGAAFDSSGGDTGSQEDSTGSGKGWKSRLRGWGSSKGGTSNGQSQTRGTGGGEQVSLQSPQTQEEAEALEQAEIWMTIAEQSKQKGSEPKGASDAADWAIQRSLSALKYAEQDQGGGGGARGGGFGGSSGMGRAGGGGVATINENVNMTANGTSHSTNNDHGADNSL